MLYRRKGSANYWCRFRIGNREVRQSCGTARSAPIDAGQNAAQLGAHSFAAACESVEVGADVRPFPFSMILAISCRNHPGGGGACERSAGRDCRGWSGGHGWLAQAHRASDDRRTVTKRLQFTLIPLGGLAVELVL